MSGHKREKRIGGLTVLALLLLTFTICTTGALNAKADELKKGEFAVVVTPERIPVTCPPGATSGTGQLQVKVTKAPRTPRNFKTGTTLKPVNATWPGGGSVTINKFDQFFRSGPEDLFPCPAGSPTIRPASFSSSPPMQLAAYTSAAPAPTLLGANGPGQCVPPDVEVILTVAGVTVYLCVYPVNLPSPFPPLH